MKKIEVACFLVVVGSSLLSFGIYFLVHHKTKWELGTRARAHTYTHQIPHATHIPLMCTYTTHHTHTTHTQNTTSPLPYTFYSLFNDGNMAAVSSLELRLVKLGSLLLLIKSGWAGVWFS